MDIYQICPEFKKGQITLRQTETQDAEELLNCYSDEAAVPLFNSDNCHGDDFYYTTLERMKQAIDFWDFSYKNRYFVRWTIIINDTEEIIGTIEMFHRIAEDEFNHFGILRIDLQSRFEKQEIINDILEIVNENLYQAFEVNSILTKAIPLAGERIQSLLNNGYSPMNKRFMGYDDYYRRNRVDN
ncbi:acetyltransferase (GNAT) family protein [Mobilisporobacter senegalensis]|uniref:Acetyltransferase (GNAT) family protein n=1 Tax=Mobilisporobacter senegalensis TaxID=1329262 RepID=A0A3N1XA29_9FIRM|nr:GNAT family protein [Mobilisporobacter senegalensis]ROR23616.1 acetyltransferase (GNAT) family protein [Mobilisporobacter senegalensis]